MTSPIGKRAMVLYKFRVEGGKQSCELGKEYKKNKWGCDRMREEVKK